jgi:hypothetical protein
MSYHVLHKVGVDLWPIAGTLNLWLGLKYLAGIHASGPGLEETQKELFSFHRLKSFSPMTVSRKPSRGASPGLLAANAPIKSSTECHRMLKPTSRTMCEPNGGRFRVVVILGRDSRAMRLARWTAIITTAMLFKCTPSANPP